MKVLPWIIGILTVLMLVAGIVYGYTLSEIEMVDVLPNDLSMDTQGFTLSGDIQIDNGGLIPITITSIEYELVLEDSDEVLITGDTQEFTLPPKETTAIPFKATTAWEPSLDVMQQVLGNERVYGTLRGNVTLGLFGEVTFPFTRRIDLTEYVINLASEQAEQFSNTLNDLTTEDIANLARAFLG